MKIFVDECIDWRLTRSLQMFEVFTARQMGWSTLKNGTLLREAANQFDVFITVDRGLEFQNNIPEISIAVVVLICRTNRLQDLEQLIPDLLAKLPLLKLGTVTYING